MPHCSKAEKLNACYGPQTLLLAISLMLLLGWALTAWLAVRRSTRLQQDLELESSALSPQRLQGSALQQELQPAAGTPRGVEVRPGAPTRTALESLRQAVGSTQRGAFPA